MKPSRSSSRPWILFVLFCYTLFGFKCGDNKNTGNPQDYETTNIWFDLHLTNEKEQKRLDSLISLDTTYWGLHSAPFFFRMPGHGNNSNLTLNNGPFHDETKVRIYALGEAIGKKMVDYGWLINTKTNDTIWKMTYNNTRFAGGDPRNRKYIGEMVLPPGGYQLEYVTNDSHSYESWVGEKPENPEYWGVLIYRIDVVKKIKGQQIIRI